MTKLYLITIIPFSDERFLWECTIFICTGVVGFTGRYFFGVDLGGGYIFSGVANANSATPGARIRASWKELNGCFLWTIHYSNEAVLHFQINNEQTISIYPSDLRIAIRPKNSLFTKCVCVRNYFLAYIG